MKITATILILFMMLLSACYYDIQEELHPELLSSLCDTSDITFSGVVSNILSTNCVSCHRQNLASGSVMLDNYNDVRSVALDGRLIGTIDHQDGFVPMPQNLPLLSECDRTIIKNWVVSGSPDN
jgi:hypothetical protein